MQARIQGIAVCGDQITRYQNQVRTEIISRIHHLSEFSLAQERTQMNIAELHEPETLEIAVKVGDEDVNLADAEGGSLDQCAESDHHERRCDCRSSSRTE
jgi:hypothetical protein